ncbi:hypothetical protein [Micromonospora sp. IBHARD004]|uniref:hypothetical protein n=1 Tax=Micromonospora sp. IBHARD004 TaxID=3457764 RepID=UPI0040596BC5
MADYTPVYVNGISPFTKTASATITGGQVVSASGVGTVAPSGAAVGTVVGVAAHDAASGARVSVWPLVNIEHELTVGTGTVTATGGVQTGASGTVDPATTSIAAASAAGTLIGIATTTAASGSKVRFVGRT